MKFVQPQQSWSWLPRLRAGMTARKWQQSCYDIITTHLQSGDAPAPAMIRAIMGSGKSILMAEIARSCALDKRECVVVSTSTIRLVEQLESTFRAALESGPMRDKVGTYYTHGKDVHTPVILTCLPSVADLANVLAAHEMKCALWIADEAHRTEAPKLKEAQLILKPQRTLGLTATPWRSNAEERLTLFEKLIFDYGPKAALDEGNVVVPWRIIPWTGGETNLNAACIEMTRNARGPGMFSAMEIDDAIAFAEVLTAHSLPSEAIHSRLSRGEIKRRIEWLRTGKLRSIVHVNMLQEGADFPWLRWLCLRRRVASRVRFAQEVGRALRYFKDPDTGEEKTEAIVYDPHGLFSVMRMSYEAVLGGEYEVDRPDESEAQELAREVEQSAFEMMEHLVNAQAGTEPLSVTPLTGYLTELITAFDLCGLIERKIAGRSWRSQPCTGKQTEAVQKMLWASTLRCVPQVHRRAMAMLASVSGSLNRGYASDMLSILGSLADKRTWPDLKHLERAASEGIKQEQERNGKTTMETISDIPDAAPRPRMKQATLALSGGEVEVDF